MKYTSSISTIDSMNKFIGGADFSQIYPAPQYMPSQPFPDMNYADTSSWCFNKYKTTRNFIIMLCVVIMIIILLVIIFASLYNKEKNKNN